MRTFGLIGIWVWGLWGALSVAFAGEPAPQTAPALSADVRTPPAAPVVSLHPCIATVSSSWQDYGEKTLKLVCELRGFQPRSFPVLVMSAGRFPGSILDDPYNIVPLSETADDKDKLVYCCSSAAEVARCRMPLAWMMAASCPALPVLKGQMTVAYPGKPRTVNWRDANWRNARRTIGAVTFSLTRWQWNAQKKTFSFTLNAEGIGHEGLEPAMLERGLRVFVKKGDKRLACSLTSDNFHAMWRFRRDNWRGRLQGELPAGAATAKDTPSTLGLEVEFPAEFHRETLEVVTEALPIPELPLVSAGVMPRGVEKMSAPVAGMTAEIYEFSVSRTFIGGIANSGKADFNFTMRLPWGENTAVVGYLDGDEQPLKVSGGAETVTGTLRFYRGFRERTNRFVEFKGHWREKVTPGGKFSAARRISGCLPQADTVTVWHNVRLPLTFSKGEKIPPVTDNGVTVTEANKLPLSGRVAVFWEINPGVFPSGSPDAVSDVTKRVTLSEPYRQSVTNCNNRKQLKFVTRIDYGGTELPRFFNVRWPVQLETQTTEFALPPLALPVLYCPETRELF